jgi:hypothetical protein
MGGWRCTVSLDNLGKYTLICTGTLKSDKSRLFLNFIVISNVCKYPHFTTLCVMHTKVERCRFLCTKMMIKYRSSSVGAKPQIVGRRRRRRRRRMGGSHKCGRRFEFQSYNSLPRFFPIVYQGCQIDFVYILFIS